MAKRLAYYLSHPIQYFSPLLRALSKASQLNVYYFSDNNRKGMIDAGFGQAIQWDVPLLEGYDHQFLKNVSRRSSLDNHFLDVINPGLLPSLWKTKSRVVIVNGWTYSSTLLVIFFGPLLGKKVWLRAENPLNQELEKSRKTLLLKKLLLKGILFRFVSKFLYIGEESRRFFEYYGVSPSRLVYTPYAVDNELFQRQFGELKDSGGRIREELGLPADKKIILFSGKYISKKRPMDLLRAFAMLGKGDHALVMMGEGELRKEMEAYIQEHKLQEVYLTGFVNQSGISKYYTIADVFVMCSGAGETWGLSVNEAMNFEKPVIVSRACGCCSDLVRHGENGFAFETEDVAELAGHLKKTLEDDVFRVSAGKKSVEIINRYSIQAIVANIISALN